ncbi:TetR/AcrR family transcriptional regulator [Aureibaculum luteum]|uniref:TetR/AcrR family transcriptional regulator n=1 Tax=Aureibaculum luteum TaxID=1548456 RepID=UPI000E4E6678|nr:TetR/AcrR family transcriptional regulator [Aureibaculum luteum]
MGNRQTNILSASRKLFNNFGYGNVTIRMIALELKISSGNLNYHFKKREDILEALYFEMVAEFDSRIKHLEERELTLKTIKEDILLSMLRMSKYHFFWTDIYNLLRLNDKIKSHFEEVYKTRFKGYNFLLNTLIEKGIIITFEFSKERQCLIERMIGFSNTWLYNSILYQNEINQSYIESQSDSLMLMLYPYLTEFGKSEFKALFPDSIII